MALRQLQGAAFFYGILFDKIHLQVTWNKWSGQIHWKHKTWS